MGICKYRDMITSMAMQNPFPTAVDLIVRVRGTIKHSKEIMGFIKYRDIPLWLC